MQNCILAHAVQTQSSTPCWERARNNRIDVASSYTLLRGSCLAKALLHVSIPFYGFNCKYNTLREMFKQVTILDGMYILYVRCRIILPCVMYCLCFCREKVTVCGSYICMCVCVIHLERLNIYKIGPLPTQVNDYIL